uniref:Calcineurin-like phosphoesterase domain-containing protein n=1 Tax=Arundo donax TaxID=35708 RepID=A0A0A8Y0E9_ARUDO
MDAAIAPPIDMKLPWAAVLGNHDQEGTLSREGVMRHLVGTTNSHSSFNPEGVEIDGYGNYNFAVYGVEGSPLSEKSVLNLYFLDSGDYSTVSSVHGYGWIKRSQQDWFHKICSSLQRKYMNHYPAQKEQASGIAFFHMLLPEFSSFTAINITGVKQEGISWRSTLGSFPPWWRLEM